MDSSLVPAGYFSDNADALLVAGANKDKKHRLNKYVAWLDEAGRSWAMPDLRAYRDYLRQEAGLSPESVAVHLATVRSRYRDLLLDRDLFFAFTPQDMDFLTRKALVDELIVRIQNAIDPRSATVRVRKHQDRSDSEHLRLTHDQARALLMAPDKTALAGLRDAAVISFLLSTGVREAELCAVHVPDLRERINGQLALRIRSGKGMKQRMVPYGAMDWGLRTAEAWMRAAGITSGPVFRGLRKGDKIRDTALNERTIQKILARYPIEIDESLTIVRPHDCRRTYARWLYDAGVKVDAIQKNMGHESIEMTFHYIGDPEIEDRLPPKLDLRL